MADQSSESRALLSHAVSGQSRLWTFGGLVVSALLLWLSFRDVDLAGLWQSLAGSNYYWVMLGALANLANLWFRAVRWRHLLRPIKSVRDSVTFSATMIGFMANNLLPARSGELVKVYVLAEDGKLSKAAVLATVVAERLFDLALLLALSLAILLGGLLLVSWMEASVIAAALLGVSLTVILVLVSKYATRLASLPAVTDAVLRWKGLRRVSRGVVSFSEGTAWLTQRHVIAPAFGASIAIWASMLVNVFCLIIAFHLPTPLWAALVLLAGQSFGAFVPSGPAQIGTYQFIIVTVLGLLGTNPTEAFALSVALHATRFFPTTAIGLLYLFRWFRFRSRQTALEPSH